MFDCYIWYIFLDKYKFKIAVEIIISHPPKIHDRWLQELFKPTTCSYKSFWGLIKEQLRLPTNI